MIVTLHDRENLRIVTRYLEEQERISNEFKSGLTSGCFDLFHYYHLLYLEKCRRQCDFLIVGVDSDSLVREFKGKDRPVFPEIHRMKLLDALVHVDVVFVMDRVSDFDKMSQIMSPKLIFKNDAFNAEEIAGLKYGGALKIIPDVEEITSTSDFIKKMQKQNIPPNTSESRYEEFRIMEKKAISQEGDEDENSNGSDNL